MTREMSGTSRALAGEMRAEMARHGVNQTELARRLGATQAWVSRRVSLTADVSMSVDDIVAIGGRQRIVPLSPAFVRDGVLRRRA